MVNDSNGIYYFVGVDKYYETPEEASKKCEELEAILIAMGAEIVTPYKTIASIYAVIEDTAVVEKLRRQGYTVNKAPQNTLHI